MSTPDDQNCNCRHLLADEETWEIILDPAFCNDPGAADALAHLLFILKKAIASGPEGSMRVINTLQDGIRMVWPYTEEHRLARELYEIYLSGDLKPWDEPRQLLEGALERSRTKAKCKARRPKVAEEGSKRRKSGERRARA
ncbi:MAG TPA: hypothetical protein VEW46_00440 [Pyrinomonadaceae bacterium]|nr:hypothetical protein [Pyrinomonadaceae bacterium]